MKAKRKCRHIKSGVIYNSAKELSEDLGVSLSKVYHILNFHVKDSVGIEYIEPSLIGTVIKEAKCKECEIVKPREDFGIDSRLNIIRGYTCKKCRSKREAKRRIELGADEMRIRRIKSMYKVSRIEAENLFAIKSCQICKEYLPNTKDRHVDHCHKSGEVRGVLCSGCNLALGHAKESVDNLKNMIIYLENQK